MDARPVGLRRVISFKPFCDEVFHLLDQSLLTLSIERHTGSRLHGTANPPSRRSSRHVGKLRATGTLPAAGILGLAQDDIAAIACVKHDDCASGHEYRHSTVSRPRAVCEAGGCVSMKPNATCKTDKDCGDHRNCRAGRCVFGGLGATCDVTSVHCMPGFACNATTGRCVRGVAGAVCRYEHNCGFGHSCFFGPDNCNDNNSFTVCIKHERRGECRLGLAGTPACLRDMHCAGPLRSFQRRDKNIRTKYSCARSADLPSALTPKTFGKCVADSNCKKSGGIIELGCIRGKCIPSYLGQYCSSK